MGRGGSRAGAGRPRKSERTKPIRIPEKMLASVLSFVATGGYKFPLYSSSVAAGFPSPADEHVEAHLDLNDLLINNPSNTFLVRVSGESMQDAGIHPGDILVVDKSMEPMDNKIVIAAIDGYLTVKRLRKNKENIYQLLPENKQFKAIEVTPEAHVHLWGVVTHVIHSV